MYKNKTQVIHINDLVLITLKQNKLWVRYFNTIFMYIYMQHKTEKKIIIIIICWSKIDESKRNTHINIIYSLVLLLDK